MKIDKYEFIEFGRNDVFVIFKIPTSQIITTNGKYDIVDADSNTYITSGNYSII